MLIASLMSKYKALLNKRKYFSSATHSHKSLKRVQSKKTTPSEQSSHRILETNNANGRVKSIADTKANT